MTLKEFFYLVMSQTFKTTSLLCTVLTAYLVIETPNNDAGFFVLITIAICFGCLHMGFLDKQFKEKQNK